jgi:hypothetical protein
MDQSISQTSILIKQEMDTDCASVPLVTIPAMAQRIRTNSTSSTSWQSHPSALQWLALWQGLL